MQTIRRLKWKNTIYIMSNTPFYGCLYTLKRNVWVFGVHVLDVSSAAYFRHDLTVRVLFRESVDPTNDFYEQIAIWNGMKRFTFQNYIPLEAAFNYLQSEIVFLRD